MKQIKFLTLMLAVVLFAACNEDNYDCSCCQDGEGEAVITGSIGALKTRATDKSWEPGDAIGIYALESEQALADASIHNGYSNVKYTTAGGNEFTAASTKIEFPEQGNLDFISYYPYQQTVSNYSLSVDVTTQSTPAAIDLLYANNAKGNNSSNANVALVFQHMLSKLVLNVSTGKGLSSLEGLTAKMEGVVVDGTFKLADGSVTMGSTKKAITPMISIANDKQSALITAIVVPGQDLKNIVIEFTVAGKTFKWTPNAQVLAATTKYTHTLKLALDDSGSGTVVEADITGTIEDWTEGNTGGNTIILNPIDSPTFSASLTSLTFGADADLSKTFKLTAEDTQDWTASSNASWLTLAPANGTGSKDITATAEANTATTERSAEITLTPAGSSSLSPITISVTQNGKTTTPPTDGSLLFPGSDFEDWSAFMGSLNKYGLQSYATQSSEGRNGSKALSIKGGNEKKNDYVFTVTVPDDYTVPSKISFYLKGTAPSKSISINIYGNDGSTYYKYNLGTVTTSDVTLNPEDKNAYDGSINTNGQWVKVTLDLTSLSGLQTTKGQNMFALKVGKATDWDVLIDDIIAE